MMEKYEGKRYYRIRAAVNAGLLRPDLVEKVVADSFDGRTLGEDFTQKLINERAGAKQDKQAAWFYQWCQGRHGETGYTG